VDVTGEPVKQVCKGSFVMMQVTLLPFASVLVVYVELFDPTLDPFTCHW
jgi:hypothetical protein